MLPLKLVLALARSFGFIGWYLARSLRETALHNLEIALGDDSSIDHSASDEDPSWRATLRRGRDCDVTRQPSNQRPRRSVALHLQRIARESFIRFTENMMAAAWMSSRRDQELNHLLEVSGVDENLVPAIRKGRGVVHVVFHLGNWEALARIVSQIPFVRFSTIYQPLRNKHFNRLVSRWRRRSGVALINRHKGFSDAVARLRKGEAVGMLVDQHAGDHGMWVPFFGRLASTTILPALLARRTGATIIPIFCRATGPVASDGRQASRLPYNFKKNVGWQVDFAPPITTQGRNDGEIMSEIHSRLEEVIRQDPANWFWLHDRWKTPSPNFLLKKYRHGIYVPPGQKLKPFRILIRTTNWLGDAILTIPAVRAIKEGRPDAHVTIMSPEKLASLWKSQSYVDEVVTSLTEARSKYFDAAILFPNSLRSALEIWRLGIPRRQGYQGHWREWLLTAVCPESNRATLWEHDVNDFNGLAKWMGAEIINEIPVFETPNSESPASSLEPRASSKGYVILHPGAAHGTAKRWLPERFVELVKTFNDVSWRLIGSSDECERNRALASQMGSHVEDWTGRLNLTQLASVLKEAKTVVCNDSGPMHLAAAVGTPVIAIFGSTEPQHTGPLGVGHQVIRRVVECSPCYRKECPIDLRCMKAVSVEEVAKALREILILKEKVSR